MKKRNVTIEYIKGLAILSVISAHCNSVSNSSNQFAIASSLFLQNIGTLGVICFFVISGVLFHHPGKNVGIFFKRKLKNIGIPWLISATCVYLYVYLRKPQMTLHSWLNFIFGNGSYCYYLTILMVLYLIFTVIPFMRTNLALVLCEMITIVSTIWFYGIWEINPYLNILNWIGYFALGVQIAREQSILAKIKEISNSNSLLCIAIYIGYVLLLGFQIYNGRGGSYWNGINVISCWIGAITLVLLAKQCEKREPFIVSKIIHQAGVDSFTIYIWHMPIAGIMARIMCNDSINWLVLVRPIIVLLIMLVTFSVAKKWIKKIKLCRIARYFGLQI